MHKLLSSTLIIASISTVAFAQAPENGAKGEAEQTRRLDAPRAHQDNETGSSDPTKTKDGTWSGTCVQQGKGGAPSGTTGTTDGSGAIANNC